MNIQNNVKYIKQEMKYIKKHYAKSKQMSINVFSSIYTITITINSSIPSKTPEGYIT